MSICLRITVSVGVQKGFLRSFLQKEALKFDVEGVAQFVDSDKVQIIACGKKETVDEFVDAVHQGSRKYKLDNIELEPFLKTKDYRGIFRIIE